MLKKKVQNCHFCSCGDTPRTERATRMDMKRIAATIGKGFTPVPPSVRDVAGRWWNKELRL